ncbi:MAG: hypothetical protein K2M54_01240 [Muribaculaceae bacterium]|nr:hypothetical protein [Muribaculaceae bacterium]MDE7459064.1 hypothetical protein [Muribaculaceae bacterium]
MNPDIKQSTQWFKRYFSLISLGVLGVVIYMIFFSETSVVNKIEYQRIIDSLRTEVELNRDSMLYYKHLNSLLTTDPEVMERVVREQHNMKRPDEDVFIFTRK